MPVYLPSHLSLSMYACMFVFLTVCLSFCVSMELVAYFCCLSFCITWFLHYLYTCSLGYHLKCLHPPCWYFLFVSTCLYFCRIQDEPSSRIKDFWKCVICVFLVFCWFFITFLKGNVKRWWLLYSWYFLYVIIYGMIAVGLLTFIPYRLQNYLGESNIPHKWQNCLTEFIFDI